MKKVYRMQVSFNMRDYTSRRYNSHEDNVRGKPSWHVYQGTTRDVK